MLALFIVCNQLMCVPIYQKRGQTWVAAIETSLTLSTHRMLRYYLFILSHQVTLLSHCHKKDSKIDVTNVNGFGSVFNYY